MIIFDTNNQPFYNNQIFKKNIAEKYPGAESIYLIALLCKYKNIQIFTADYVINNNIEITGAKIITEIKTKWTKLLLKRGAKRHAIICFETPSFAWKFYANLNTITENYKHSFLFSGTKNKVSIYTHFHPSLFPQPEFTPNLFFENKWENRKFLTLINSNQIRRIYKPLHIFYSIFDKSLSQELYSLRLNAIVYFAKYNDFHLYGRNWEKWYFGIPYFKHKIALSKYLGSVKNKIECLSKYRFAICFENAIYEGYITEKIFDCFFGGCIPIYYGAPDIDSYIPSNCFINFSDFNYNFPKLEEFLLNFTETDYNIMKFNIVNFLYSDKFKIFTHTFYSKQLFNTVTNE